MGAETRILLLSSRDPQDGFDEPPLPQPGDARPPEPRRAGDDPRRVVTSGPHTDARPWARRPAPVDSVAPVAELVLETLAAAPGVHVAHRPIFRASEVLAAIGDHRPSVVFNLCEALGGDSRLEVTVAWLLERLGLPFTGSPFHALRHCLYKVEANQILARAGVRVPATVRVDSPNRLPRVAFPVIVKPEREDGSAGIERSSVVHTQRSLRDQVAFVIETYRQPAVVQRYVAGREINVSLLGWPVPRVLPPGEILFGDLPEGHPHILTFASKWHPESVDWTGTSAVPAVLRPPELRRVAAIGRRAFEVLGLRDYGRVDVRLDERGDPYVIDVNPNCDLSGDGGFALAGKRARLSHPHLLWEVLRGALRRRTDLSALFASRGRSPRLPVRAPLAERLPRASVAMAELRAEAS